MTKYHSPNKSQSNAGKSLEEYHRQRDSLIRLNSDHFNSPNYGRGAVRRFEKRSRKMPLKLILWRILLALLFFGSFGFVFYYGIMEWTR